MLEASTLVEDGRRYATKTESLCRRDTNDGTWHGYPFRGTTCPTASAASSSI